jgi:hypothetical protein
MLIDLFERIGRFFNRLECYTERTPSQGMTDMMVEVMVEVLSVLAIATMEIRQKRRSQFITSNFWVLTHVSLEKFLKKLLGRNDIEDALKRLDKLTQEEAKMATAEVFKSTRNVDDNLKMLNDGIQRKFFSHTCCPDVLYRQMTRRRERFCNKRSVRHFLLLPHILLEAQSLLQESKCDETSTVGFLPLIPQRIITSPATLTMREQPPGSFRVVYLKSGNQRLRSCGYMANVCFRHS